MRRHPYGIDPQIVLKVIQRSYDAIQVADPLVVVFVGVRTRRWRLLEGCRIDLIENCLPETSKDHSSARFACMASCLASVRSGRTYFHHLRSCFDGASPESFRPTLLGMIERTTSFVGPVYLHLSHDLGRRTKFGTNVKMSNKRDPKLCKLGNKISKYDITSS